MPDPSVFDIEDIFKNLPDREFSAEDKEIIRSIISTWPNKPLYRPDEAAKCLEINQRTIYRLYGDNKLPGVLMGGKVLRLARYSVVKYCILNYKRKNGDESIEEVAQKMSEQHRKRPTRAHSSWVRDY